MATFYQRGPYQWEASVRRKGFPEERKTLESKKEAQDWAREIERAMRLGQYVPMGKSEKAIFGDLIDRYAREISPSKKNCKSETQILARIKARLGQYSLVAITSELVCKVRDELVDAGRAASTVNHYLNAISVVVDMAIKEWGYPLSANPVANVSRPAQPNGRDRRLLPGEEKRILRECRRYRNPVLEPMVRLALETAARQGELFSLKWEDVDLVKRVAHFRGKDGGTTKNDDAFRAVPLSAEAVRILQGLKPAGKIQRLPRGPVFKANVAATRIAFMRAIERARARYVAACTRIEHDPDPRFLVDFVFHDLRHEATSRLFERDVFDMMEVASITGHKTMSMLKRYTHLRAEDLARKMG
jgi:integrase